MCGGLAWGYIWDGRYPPEGGLRVHNVSALAVGATCSEQSTGYGKIRRGEEQEYACISPRRRMNSHPKRGEPTFGGMRVWLRSCASISSMTASFAATTLLSRRSSPSAWEALRPPPAMRPITDSG